MANIQMTVPTVGESITEVTIGKWTKKDGDFVKAEELLVELESDKATFELNSQAEGILRIKAKSGDVLPIGGLICEIEASAGNGTVKETPKPETKSQPSSVGKTVELVVPTVGESITEVTLGKWNKKSGDLVKAEEVLVELESDKATFELTASATGILEVVAASGQVLPIGALICKIAVTADMPVNTSKETPVTTNNGDASAYAKGHPSPSANKLLSEKGIDPADVKGSGKDGRITKEDAMNAQKKSETITTAKKETPVMNTVPGSRQERSEKMTSLRKTISRRLVAVKNETAMLTTFNEVDMKPIMDLRAKYKDAFKEKHEVGLGFMSFFTKAVTMALKEFPAVNAYIQGEEIIYHDYADISIAVSAPKGLMVPVIRNAESMSFDQIEKEIVRLALKARDNKLSIDEMTGGTFTITNGGIFGSMLSTPIINAPQSAILGMHNIVERPVVQGGQIVIRPIMYVALSYDHRIIDGRESVGFLVRVKQLLEDPSRILLGV
ncbi:MAG: 2-oxoglutarate dehydrogenase complex dihydrolipoyllysine-residue succinyltransferase [Cytophagaceae bacterium]|jgi:2-oxoglutarate dehydrogenase E2 component (dihydrolipoamide succinyltransferase)|nr:2-oxoglutarate dehydrogenase complex dihydrolipoyllysine-residue succinyltransferase [Cytophagaceae bacterium]